MRKALRKIDGILYTVEECTDKRYSMFDVVTALKALAEEGWNVRLPPEPVSGHAEFTLIELNSEIDRYK